MLLYNVKPSRVRRRWLGSRVARTEPLTQGGHVHPLPPEALPAVPYFTFTLLKVPFTIAWPNLIAWLVVIAAFVAGAWARLPRWIG